ncbi:hypothetical protein [Rhizobium sp. Root1220]|uniref:hypothetical protein n=1 Tax=Rhizobium sp. Root1220 TaxID=1736432 RepID=UPI000701BF56|nr:hypothetical protein [Rhizobium sp. Root1220]KQV83170.1 hypothetical protein ASC90_21435 [Rhizobium sp. Root1220]
MARPARRRSYDPASSLSDPKTRATGELIYPTELEERIYQGFGSFFFDGNDVADVDKSYVFYALRDGELLPLILERIGVRYSYQVYVVGIGRFVFRATTAGVPSRYSGTSSTDLQQTLVRQLASTDRQGLNDAARRHDFYFVGFTPMLIEIFGAPLPDGGLPTGAKKSLDEHPAQGITERSL